MAEAINEKRFECLYIWGFQGSKKSNLTLQQGGWIYGERKDGEWLPDYDMVLKYLVLRPGKGERGLQSLLQSIGEGRRVPWIGWDDLTVNYNPMSYKTDIQQYAAVDSMFACARMKTNNIVCNSPVIDRLTKNVKDNVSIEVYSGRNQRIMTERICRLPSHKRMESFFFKVPIEAPYVFSWSLVPKDVWMQYEDLRNRLTEETIAKLGEAYKDEVTSLDDYIPLYDIVQQGIATPSQIIAYSTRDIITVVKVNGKRYVAKDDVEQILKHLKKKQQKLSAV